MVEYGSANAFTQMLLGGAHGLHFAMAGIDLAERPTASEVAIVPDGPHVHVRRLQARQVEEVAGIGG